MAQSCKQMEMEKKGERKKDPVVRSVRRQSDLAQNRKPRHKSSIVPRLWVDRRKFNAMRNRVNVN